MHPQDGIRTRKTALAAFTLCLALTSVCLGCSEDDDLSFTTLCIQFESQAPSTTPIAARTGPGTTCNRIELEIVANQDLTGVYSMALNFRYPLVGALSVDSIEPDAVWTANGATILEQYDEEPAGTVTMAISRVNPAPTFNLAKGDVLARMTIVQATATGEGDLFFVSGGFQDSALPPNTVASVPTVLPSGLDVGTFRIVQQ